MRVDVVGNNGGSKGDIRFCSHFGMRVVEIVVEIVMEIGPVVVEIVRW